MTDITAEKLAKAIGAASRSAKFCVTGTLPVADLGLEVDGLGPVKLPFKRGVAKQLLERCQPAPYGQGTETLLDKQVRNTAELGPDKFRLSDAGSAAVAGAVRSVAEQLGLPADQLEARLYKLLVYEKGGFFLPHRDSEKHDRMVASLIIVLPTPFQGGGLVVRHHGATQRVAFADAAAGTAACFAAFYADCEHEVQRVTHGVRLCLAYNLVLKPAPKAKRAAGPKPAAAAELAESLAGWAAKQPGRPLVFALDHHYTQRGLSQDLLKGADRRLADLVAAAAEQAGCVVSLAQVTRHLSQFADDGSFEESYYSRSYRRAPRRHAMTIGETYEDELNASEWADLDGKKQPWGPIPFEPAAVVSDVPLDDWKPTREEFEGYTGNAGNTLDRWYHRSAVVVWHRDHHYEVLTAAGARDCVPLFKSMVAKLARTPKKRLDAARTECVRFAHAIVDRWPERGGGFWRSVAEEASPNDFPDSLLLLHDRDTVARFLATAADRDQTLRLGAFIREACREFGWGAFAKELKHLLVAKPAKYPGREDRTIPFRDIEWLSEVCCDPATGPDRLALAAELCGRVVERFCALRPPRRETDSYYYGRPEPSITKDAMPLLVEAVAAGRDELLTKVVEFIQSLPQEFNLDDYQVPTLKDVIPWSQKRFGSVPPPLAAWLSAVRRQLEAATAQPPTRPANWARPAEVACTCQYCSRLNAFLADPASPATNIPAPEDQRQHLAGMISRHQCDVEHTLKREGRPYSLALTKTYGSFKRAVARFEADGRLLRALPAAD